MDATDTERTCSVCRRTFPQRELVAAPLVRDNVAALVRADVPSWDAGSRICRHDLARYRAEYLQGLLNEETGELSALETAVVQSLTEHQILSRDLDEEVDQERRLGERLADVIAEFGGSWTFVLAFSGFVVLWIAVNSVVAARGAVDPYPFILLNLVLSCVAALQAPVIMMSQNRQEAKDRIRARHDYQVNLKAELEIRQLHEKVDHLLRQQWERLVEIQRLQLDTLQEIGGR